MLFYKDINVFNFESMWTHALVNLSRFCFFSGMRRIQDSNQLYSFSQVTIRLGIYFNLYIVFWYCFAIFKSFQHLIWCLIRTKSKFSRNYSFVRCFINYSGLKALCLLPWGRKVVKKDNFSVPICVLLNPNPLSALPFVLAPCQILW